MKKLILLLCILLSLLGCGKEEVLPEEELSESSSSLEEALPEEPEEPKEVFDPFEYGFNFCWNGEESVTFQEGNKLVTLSCDNKVLESLELPGEENSFFIWNENYIFAAGRNEENDYYGCAYLTEDGKSGFVNCRLYSRNGSLLKEFPKAQLSNQNRDFYAFAAVEGETVDCVRLIDFSKYSVYFEGSGVFAVMPFWVSYYDFETGESKVLWKGEMLNFHAGDKGVSHSVGTCKLVDGKLWFDTAGISSEDTSISQFETVYYATKDGAVKLCEGLLTTVNSEIALILECEKGYQFGAYKWVDSQNPAEITEIGERDETGYVAKVFGNKICFVDYTEKENYNYPLFSIYDVKTGAVTEYEPAYPSTVDVVGVIQNGNGYCWYSKMHDGTAVGDRESTGITYYYCYNTETGESKTLFSGFYSFLKTASPMWNYYLRSENGKAVVAEFDFE